MFSKKIYSFIRDYFTLTSRERKGAIGLATIIFIQVGWLFWKHHLAPPDPLPAELNSPQFFAFESHLIQTASTPQQVPVHLSPFDPNTLSDSGWYRMGLSEYQVRGIRKYLAGGGHFRFRDDLAKIYSLPRAQFDQLQPFITLAPADSFRNTPKAHPNQRPNQHPVIDLNYADTTELVRLPLIGAGRARMIWKYREKLGGFIHAEQLLEVFTIDSTVYEAIQSQVEVSPVSIRKLNINADTLRHPYLPWSAARAMVAYRKQHGPFTDTAEVHAIHVIPDSLWVKLAPYIGFE